jgi:hypothetical protein
MAMTKTMRPQRKAAYLVSASSFFACLVGGGLIPCIFARADRDVMEEE